MNSRHPLPRFILGLTLVIIVLIACFALTAAVIPNWGSTPSERSLTLPGDEILTSPVVRWEHAITIRANPEQIWPWIIQMGDTRGGFYSFRIIEKAMMALAKQDTSVVYNNTNEVHPEWQNPPVGQGMIMDTVRVLEYQQNQYLLAASPQDGSGFGISWLWYLLPTGDGQTRLIVHMAIQIPGMAGNRLVSGLVSDATYMMERKMMSGIAMRAQGGSEPDWFEFAEYGAGLLAFLAGILAARRFLTQSAWKAPLAIGIASIVAMFIMVYLQPALWLRILIDLVLIGALALPALYRQKRMEAKQAV